MVDTELEQDIARVVQQKVTADKLEFVRDQIRYMRDLDHRIGNLHEILKQLTVEKRELQYSTLPTLFMQNKISSISLMEEGNIPAYDAELKDFYHAKIDAEWPAEKRHNAMSWLEEHSLGDIIKTCFTIEIGRGNAKLTKKVMAALRALKVPFTQQQTVPWNTLTAAIKERYRDHKPLKDAELETLGANVGKIVTLKVKKDKS